MSLVVPTARATLAALRALAEPVCERVGCRLVAVEVLGGGGRHGNRILRLSVDRPGGSTIADCASISRQLSPALDVADIISGSYDLEVSTPGLERPVQTEEDFAWFTGCTVRVKTWDMDGRRRIQGVLAGTKDGLVTLNTDQGPRALRVDDIERAHLVLDLTQYARLGEGLHPIATPTGDPTPHAGERS